MAKALAAGVRLAAAFALAACASDAPPAVVPVADSALPAWSLAEPPVFLASAGTFAGDSVHFSRVVAGTFDGSGDAVIAVAGEQNRILWLDRRGGVTGSAGGPRSGPGGLLGVSSLFAVGDRLAAWAAQNRRLMLFRDRTLEEVVALPISSRHTVVGLLPDGTTVTTIDPRFAVFASEESPNEQGEPTRYELWDRRGNLSGTLEGAPAVAAPYYRLVHRREDSALFSTDVYGGACLPELRHLVEGDRIWIADSREGVLYALDRSGRPTELAREAERERVDAHAVQQLQKMIEDTERYVEPVLPDAERTVLEQLGRSGDPLPSAWSALVDDREGGAWLRRAACFRPDSSAERWDVVDRDGRRSATVTVPGSLRILSVSGDRVLAVVRDPAGVEHVAVFEVAR